MFLLIKLQSSKHEVSFSSASSVPLGTPLMDTAVEVRDEHGRVVTEGEGQVFIGENDLIDKHMRTNLIFS